MLVYLYACVYVFMCISIYVCGNLGTLFVYKIYVYICIQSKIAPETNLWLHSIF